MTTLRTSPHVDNLLPQYSAGRVIALWASAALPMAVLGWVMNPWLADSIDQPWGIPRSVVDGVFLFALPAARLRSTWISIAVHSTQSVFFAVVLIPLVLGRS